MANISLFVACCRINKTDKHTDRRTHKSERLIRAVDDVHCGVRTKDHRTKKNKPL